MKHLVATKGTKSLYAETLKPDSPAWITDSRKGTKSKLDVSVAAVLSRGYWKLEPGPKKITKSGPLSGAFGDAKKHKAKQVRRLKQTRGYKEPRAAIGDKKKRRRKKKKAEKPTFGSIVKHHSPKHSGTSSSQKVHGNWARGGSKTTTGAPDYIPLEDAKGRKAPGKKKAKPAAKPKSKKQASKKPTPKKKPVKKPAVKKPSPKKTPEKVDPKTTKPKSKLKPKSKPVVAQANEWLEGHLKGYQDKFGSVPVQEGHSWENIKAMYDPFRKIILVNSGTKVLESGYYDSLDASSAESYGDPLSDMDGGMETTDSYVVVHEYGHHVLESLKRKDQKEWFELWKTPAPGQSYTVASQATSYSVTDYTEGFAEVFALVSHPSYDRSGWEGKEVLPLLDWVEGKAK